MGVIRTPLLPAARWFELGDGLSGALEADVAQVRSRMERLLARPEVWEAIYLASPSLIDSIPAWRKAPDSERGQKVEAALLRYVARMATRPTPFGLFAGSGLVHAGASTTRFERGPRPTRHTRIDLGFLDGVTRQLALDPEVRASLTYRPNSSAYLSVDQFRYVEVRYGPSGRSYSLAAIDSSEAITQTLERAEHGAKLQTLAGALCEDPEISPEDAEAFLLTLVDAQLLVPDLEPQVTGRDPFRALLADLNGLGEAPLAKEASSTLETVSAALRALDSAPLGQPPERYQDMAQRLSTLPSATEPKALFQVDLLTPGTFELGPGIQRQLQRTVELVDRLIPRRSSDPRLPGFQAAFERRYGDREVRVVDALDEESGIGFGQVDSPSGDPSPLLRALPWSSERDPPPPWSNRERYLLDRVLALEPRGEHALELELETLPPWDERPVTPSAPAQALYCSLRASSPEALERGEAEIYAEALSGPSGVRIFARFLHLLPELEAAAAEHHRLEEAMDPDAVFAEIVHLPEGRIGNIIQRPVLRGFEIVYLGRSGAAAEQRLPITDLRLRLRDGRMELRSTRLQKRVVPRLTNAHGFSQPGMLAVYRFLALFTGEAVSSNRSWDWGSLASLPHLPRVHQGNIVVSLERWNLDAGELAKLRVDSREALFTEARALQRRRCLPRHVLWVEGDNMLPVDFDNVLSVHAFVAGLGARTHVELRELWEQPHTLVVSDGAERFCQELTLTTLHSATPSAKVPEPPASSTRISARFAPGSEWLYAKVYGGTASADRLLVEALGPVITESLAAGHADGWFFIRYADPEPHLRLRFHGSPDALLQHVLPALHAALEPAFASGAIHSLVLDTYDREALRYGGTDAIAPVEALFAADSSAALDILAQTDLEVLPEARWRLALLGSHRLLEELGLDFDTRRAIAAELRAGYHREHRVDAAFKQKLSERFRGLRAELETLLEGRGASSLEAGFQALAARAEKSAPQVAQLRKLAAGGRLATSLAEIGKSLVHMHVNRLVRGSPRAHELVLYDFLDRLYSSAAVRAESRSARSQSGG